MLAVRIVFLSGVLEQALERGCRRFLFSDDASELLSDSESLDLPGPDPLTSYPLHLPKG